VYRDPHQIRRKACFCLRSAASFLVLFGGCTRVVLCCVVLCCVESGQVESSRVEILVEVSEATSPTTPRSTSTARQRVISKSVEVRHRTLAAAAHADTVFAVRPAEYLYSNLHLGPGPGTPRSRGRTLPKALPQGPPHPLVIGPRACLRLCPREPCCLTGVTGVPPLPVSK
jgi:hypothetical protein